MQGRILVSDKEGRVIQIDCRTRKICFEGHDRSAQRLAAYLDEALGWQVFGADIEHLMWPGDDQRSSDRLLDAGADDSELDGPEI